MKEKTKKARKLLERALTFIDWMKFEQGEFDDDNLEKDIRKYLSE